MDFSINCAISRNFKFLDPKENVIHSQNFENYSLFELYIIRIMKEL